MAGKGIAVMFAVLMVLSGLALISEGARAFPPLAAHQSSPPSVSEAPVSPALVPGAAQSDLGWQPPVALETKTSTSSNLAGIALSSGGTGMVVWQRTASPRNVLMASHYLPGGRGDAGSNWQVPVQISTSANDIGYNFNFAVAMDAAGDAVAVYYTWNDVKGYAIYAVSYQAGVGWQAPVQIDQPSGWSFSPAVAMNDAGTVFVDWYVYPFANYYTIWANRYVPGTGWGTAHQVETTTNYTYSPDIAVDGTGNAIATWYEYDGGTYHVYGARFSTVSGWLAPLSLTTAGNYSIYPSVAMDSAGNGYVAWVQWEGHYDVWAKRYDHTTGWAPATRIDSSTYSAGYTPGPQVAASNGNATVVWTQTKPISPFVAGIYDNRYVAGTGWVGAVEIDGASVAADNGRVAIDSTGNVTVVYVYHPTSSPPNQVVDEAVRYNHVTSSWGYSQLDYDRVGNGAPLVAVDAAGNVLAAWNYNTNSNPSTPAVEGVLTNHYTAGSGWAPYYAAQAASWDSAISPNWLQLETNTAGDAIFSFTQDDGPTWNGYAALYTPGAGWGPVTKVANLNGTYVSEEWSAIDGAGNALVLFRGWNGSYYNVYATYYSVGSGWGTPQRLDNGITTSNDNKFWLRVSLNDRGDGVAMWEEYNGTNWNDYAAFFSGTTHTWGAAAAIQSTYTYLGTGVVAIDGNGRAMAVYDAWNGTAYTNYASYYQPGTGWGTPVQIAHSTMSTNAPYQVEMNAAGDATVSWTYWNGTRNLAAVNVFTPAAGWGTETIFNSGPGDEGPATPSLDGAGDAMLAYNVWDGAQFDAYVVLKPAAGAWGVPVRISSGSGDASGLATALDYHGNGFVVWNQFNGLGYDTLARRYVSGVGWMPQVTVNLPAPATPSTDTGSSVLGVDGHGNAILGWNEWSNGALLPFAATYVVGSGLPTLSLTAPTNGTYTNRSSVTVTGASDPGATVTVDGSSAVVAANGSFTKTVALPDGAHTFVVVAKDAAGLWTSASVSVTVDTGALPLAFTSPTAGANVSVPTILVTGTTDADSTVIVNGYAVSVSSGGTFSIELALTPGTNTITATATDPAGNHATRTLVVTYNDPLPAAQSSINSLNTDLYIAIGLAVAGLALGVLGLLRPRKPAGGSSGPKSPEPGPATPWKEQ